MGGLKRVPQYLQTRRGWSHYSLPATKAPAGSERLQHGAAIRSPAVGGQRLGAVRRRRRVENGKRLGEGRRKAGAG
jgi:hypothetical protein